MQVPISWLKDFVHIDIPAELLAEKLTLAGLEVGGIKYIGVPQNQVEGIRVPPSDHLVWDRDKLLLGAIREVKPHPDADRLVLAMVDYGADELEQCVTGAPNLFDYKGKGKLETPLWTAFAMEGAVVWDGHSDEPKLMTLKGKKLRGVYNKSMVCSEKELGISEEHEGIMLLDHDEDYVPGTPLQDILGDVVLEIELTPNLGHAFSMIGVAREVAAILNKELCEPEYDFVAEGTPIEGQVAIDIREPELNPRFTLTLLKDTKIQPSPFWMQYRLKLVGQRPINNIVDVTNYITFEIGQPLHAFDYDKLVERAGGTPTIITRLPEPGETLETLDDVKRELADYNILVCDTEGVLSMGGIIGGAETEISDETTNVLLEAASWNFINIRRTSQAQKVFTEAGTRFSRNVHPSRAILGVSRGIELMRQTGGGQIAQGIIDEYPLPPEPVQVELPISEVHRLLGIDIDIQTAAEILLSLQFEVTIEGESLHVIAPDYRTDIHTDVEGRADLVEEIVRIYGYDKVPITIMADEMPEQRTNLQFELEETLRDLLVALGLRENISYRFTTPEAEAMLISDGETSSLPEAGYVTMANPISSDKTVLRHSILTSLLENASRNARFAQSQQVFELGKIYLKRDDQPLPDEPRRLGILITGIRHHADWSGANQPQMMDFYDMKGIIEGLVEGLHLNGAAYERANHSAFHPGRSATLTLNGKEIGTFGELHPIVADRFKLTQSPVFVAELDVDALLKKAAKAHSVEALPITPAVLEDIALIVPQNISAAEVETVIRKAGGRLLKDVSLFDVYTGDPIPEGHRSLAYALTYQTDDKTLTDKDVAKVRKKIISSAQHQLGAQLRA